MLLAVLAAISTFAPPEPAAAPAPAAPPAAEAPVTDPAAAAAARPKEEAVVCKSQVVAGSRLPVKVCSRGSDDATRKRTGRDSLDKLQLNNGIRPSGS